jgi:hypothetical protein
MGIPPSSSHRRRPTVVVPPSTIFDHQPITPELCRQGLQLIAPLLSDKIKADGEFSLRRDQFIVPLASEGTPAPSPQIRGTLNLHEANIGLPETIVGKGWRCRVATRRSR